MITLAQLMHTQAFWSNKEEEGVDQNWIEYVDMDIKQIGYDIYIL